ncbi:MAG: hypothetical protein A2W25_17475 [candidate division Zixibacteria bacterium RBG_16_53_22]|nr:MAG: hypothetical protein A2W25_17475 [candidate division Zixibacteria bacterium RBG_16_53_22]
MKRTCVGLFLLLTLMFLSFKPEQILGQAPERPANGGGDSLVSVTVNAELDGRAKELAALLADPGIRNHLRAEIKRSSRREQIIFLDEFLASASKLSGQSDKVRGKCDDALGKAKKAKQRFNQADIINALVSPEVDVYFPARDHRDKWTGSDDVLVGVGTLNGEAETIKAYSVKTQQSLSLNTTEPPASPVIMVSPCEHDSHEAPPPLETSDVPQSKSETPKEGKNSYLQTSYFKITNDHEPWTSGDPEIYVLVVQWYGTSTLTKVKIYLNGVNQEGVWKDLAGCPTNLNFYWDDNYFPITYYRVMEEDPGTLMNSPVTVSAFGVSVSTYVTIRDGDDALGSVNVDRNAVGWCPYGALANCCQCWFTEVSTGEARMRMVKVH